MNCRQAQREIALLVGEDLGDDDRRRDVEAHLQKCPACRMHRARVGSALSALVAAEPATTYDSVYSVWPSLRRQLTKGTPKPGPAATWRSWAPFAAGVATCAGLLLLASSAFHEAPPGALETGRQVLPSYSSRSIESPSTGERARNAAVRPVSERFRRLPDADF